MHTRKVTCCARKGTAAGCLAWRGEDALLASADRRRRTIRLARRGFAGEIVQKMRRHINVRNYLVA